MGQFIECRNKMNNKLPVNELALFKNQNDNPKNTKSNKNKKIKMEMNKS